MPSTGQDMQEEQAERDRQMVQARADLRASVSPLALRPDLMECFYAYARDEGVIGERSSVFGTLLTLLSRLNKDQPLSFARIGAPSSGKNYVVEIVLATAGPRPNAPYPPEEAVIRMSSSSDKALVYQGGDDPYALMHKVVYVPEASSLKDAKGNEKEGTGTLRTLASEGRLDHTVPMLVKDAKGNETRVTMRVTKHGPVAVIVPTARDNIEPELLTRMMLSYADESFGQTGQVRHSRILRTSGFPPARTSGTTLADWQDYQAFLGFGGPYEVVIPYYYALRVAFHGMPLPLRARRDIDGILVGVKASAIMHQMQRQTDEKGRIVAALDDYKSSYIAFAPGLAALYRPQVGPGVIANRQGHREGHRQPEGAGGEEAQRQHQ